MKFISEDLVSLMDEANESDRAMAREAVADGVRSAEDLWIESHFILEALVAELVERVSETQSNQKIAIGLRKLADQLESKAELH